MCSTIDKDRLDALKFISETHRTLRDQRRKSQLQVFYTTLSFYGLLTISKFSNKINISEGNRDLFNVVTWVFIIIVAIFSSIYLIGLHTANAVNRDLAQNAEKEILEMVGLQSPTNAGKTIAKDRYWQIIIMITFSVVAGIALTCF